MTLSVTELQKLFSSHTLARGRELAGSDHVKSLEIRGNIITAIVDTGPGNTPHRVYVRYGDKWLAECNCGGTPTCEHIAAVLLAAADHQSRSASQTSSPDTSAEEHRFKASIKFNADKQHLLYLLQPQPDINNGLMVKTWVGRKLADGSYGNGSFYSPQRVDKANPARFLQTEDLDILIELARIQRTDDETVVLSGPDSGQLLQAIISTGRCHLRDSQSPPIRAGAPRPLVVDWKIDSSGTQHLQWQVAPSAQALLVLATVFYLDEQLKQCGEVQSPLPASLLTDLLAQPSLSPQQATRVKADVATRCPGVELPQLRTLEFRRTVQSQPIACLKLLSVVANDKKRDSAPVQCAALYFDYDGITVRIDDPSTYYDGEAVTQIHRNSEFERQCQRRLLDCGFRQLRQDKSADKDLYQLSPTPEAWIDFQYDTIPQLSNEQWRVEYDPEFEFRAMQHQQWYCETRRDNDKDWFDFTLGVYIDGERVNLLPVLLEFIKQYSPEEPLNLAAPHYTLQYQARRWMRIPGERLRAIFDALVSLYASKAGKFPQSLHLPLYQLATISELLSNDAMALDWSGDQEMQNLDNHLRNIKPPTEVTVPQTLKTELRPYQQSGLNWLQFLREHHLAGILADDMGLGKTVQTLANLLVEHQRGRMLAPSLIIAPTSLVFNWRNEICRLSPSLSVLCLHGPKRQQHFTSINKYNIVITSYPLLIRDEEALLAGRYHYLILDEAHYIKNPKTKAARCVRNINTQHKLCLTGTPLENHLGELWSLFDFLLPGYLGNQKQFQTLFRTPIEKHGDTDRAQALTRRVRPFMLRRTKDAVARELPEKTEIIHTLPLTQSQQDLYETVRLSVHRTVRGAIEREGLARSQITILDALLKLRQVCCDPRLVKMEKPMEVAESAKLLLLKEMIPEMIEEGRRILLFSQFTSMLALIEAEMETLGIDYAKLTGQTIDRAAQVERFQAGNTPLFLISLKAGGVGLNLTAADTVIHYDPWWNPAVEQQATDRAHRIGQTQPVFVYKLICEGTVEEKILALQQNKKGLADSIFQSQNPQGQRFSEEDIDELLAPLE